jgi:hypothetical protein
MNVPVNATPAGRPEDNTDLNEIRRVLGAALHEEVKAELKEEASKPARLRTRLYTALAGVVVVAFLAAMWALWPEKDRPKREERSLSPTALIKETLHPRPEDPPPDATAKRLKALEAALKQLLDLCESARAERTAFRDEVKKLLDDGRGRRIASSDELTARFRVATEDRLLEEADSFLDLPDPGSSDLLDIETKRGKAFRAVAAYRRANLSLRAVANAAAGAAPAKETLAAAVERARERDELLALGQRVTREKEARAAVERRAVEEAAKKAEREAEEKRWGNLRPGSVWKGRLAVADETVPCEFRINSRSGNKIEGVIGWDYRERRDEIAFAGEADAGRVRWKTTRRLKGDPWVGVTYDGRVEGDTISGSYRYQTGNAFAFRVTLVPFR